MWTERGLALAACAALAHPAAAGYAQAPFHDRPVAVAERAMPALAGEAVAIPQDDPAFAAAVAAILLLSGDGLAEAYEAAVAGGEDDDPAGAQGDPYARAFALMQEARRWIDAIPADAAARSDIAELLARLDALLPTAERPARLDPDPEAAEAPAQALVGALERAADADLYLSRDLRRAIGTVGTLADDACRIGDVAERRRLMAIAALYHEDALGAPLSVLAPDAAARIEAVYAMDVVADHGAACDDLAAAYADARARLFPGAAP